MHSGYPQRIEAVSDCNGVVSRPTYSPDASLAGSGWKAELQLRRAAEPNTRRCQYILGSRNHALFVPVLKRASWRMSIL